MSDDFIFRNKSSYIADSAISSYMTHDARLVSFYPILEHISLLFQRALDINVGIVTSRGTKIMFSNSWSQAEASNAFRSIKDPVLRRGALKLRKRRTDVEGDVIILVRNIEWSRDPEHYTCSHLDEADRAALAGLFESLSDGWDIDLHEIFRTGEPHVHRFEPLQGLTRPADQPLLDSAEIGRLTADLSRELDYLYQSLSMVRRHSHRAMKDTSNVFCVIRYVGEATEVRLDRFDYSAQVVYSKRQADAIDARQEYSALASRSGLSAASLLQQPLTEDSRSIADTIFDSGIIEFPIESFGEGRDSSQLAGGRSGNEGARRRLERKFLSGFGDRLMHVPIHIGGIPWAVFFMVLPAQDAEKAWLWIARYYRACVPLLGDGMRRIIRRQFLDQLSHAVEKEFRTFLTSPTPIDATLTALNSAVTKLCGFFPYAPPRFSLKWMPGDRVHLRRETVDYQISIEFEPNNPFTCFQGGLWHDRLEDNRREVTEHVTAGLERAQAARAGAQAARATFASALAHDVKNSTSEIVGRLDAPLNVLRQDIFAKYSVARENLVRANMRALMLNSIALSINTLFVEGDSLARLGARIFPRDNIENFWNAIISLLLQIRATTQEGLLQDSADPRAFRLVRASSLAATADYYDRSGAPENFVGDYPRDWKVAPEPKFNTLVKAAMDALQLHCTMKEGIADYRLGVALAMLSEIVSNIRFNKAMTSGEHARDIVVGTDLRWEGHYPVVYLQQMHLESLKSTWEPPEDVPKGIGRTLSLFGQDPDALQLMDVRVARAPNCRNGSIAVPAEGGRLCAYALRIELQLLRSKEGHRG
ncbi:MAG TPA: hypothetical protein VFR28_04965 [Allosphingosinicella sp.]|jgi:hypothetical protein|nr:hypothetical protein [Allosphingosinicella sp.]